MLTEESQHPQMGSQAIIQSLMDNIFVYVMRSTITTTGKSGKRWSSGILDDKIRKALELIHSNIAVKWTIDDLAIKLGVSRTKFAVLFKNKLGETPMAYLTKIRLERAIYMLSTTEHKIEQIAISVGYGDAYSFSKAFKRYVGINPSALRQQYLGSKDSVYRFTELLRIPHNDH